MLLLEQRKKGAKASIFLLQGWLSTGMGSQRGGGVSTLGGVRKLPGDGPGQPPRGVLAGAGLGPCDLQSSLPQPGCVSPNLLKAPSCASLL